MITTRNSCCGLQPVQTACFCCSASEMLACGMYRWGSESHRVRKGFSLMVSKEFIRHADVPYIMKYRGILAVLLCVWAYNARQHRAVTVLKSANKEWVYWEFSIKEWIFIQRLSLLSSRAWPHSQCPWRVTALVFNSRHACSYESLLQNLAWKY